MTKEDEAQYLLTLRNLMEELGVPPEQLVSNGAPVRLVTRVCEEIVASSKRPAEPTNDDIWSKTRSPLRENSSTPGLPDAQHPTHVSRASSRSRNSSPDVEVSVRTNRALSQSSDSSTEAIVERMVPPQPVQPPLDLPRAPPLSSWAAPPSLPSRLPPPLPEPSAVHLDTYRPLSRPSASAVPMSSALPPQVGASRVIRRKRRDLDSAAAFPATLDYGDDSSESDPSRPPEPAVAPPPPPPPLPPTHSTSPHVRPTALVAPIATHASTSVEPSLSPSLPTPSAPSTVRDDLAEARRRLLDSMRRRKTGTPMSVPTLSSLPTPAPISPKPTATAELADYEQEASGSAAEVPMDIDTEMEDGEIVDKESSTGASDTAPAQPVPVYPNSRAGSRGLKRPHAEDLMDLPSRPASVTRLALPRRKIFCITAQRTVKLSMPLDDDDSESESEDESPAPIIEPPIIEIPPDWETVRKNDEQARAIAEKEAHIRHLREQIAMLAAKKEASAQATPNGSLTPATAQSIAESAIKSAIGMTGAPKPQAQSLASATARLSDDAESKSEGLQDLFRSLTLRGYHGRRRTW